MTPGDADLWFLPLGGCGEIGMNMNLYGHAGEWLMIDCGVTFAREGEPGPHVQMADPAFIAARRDRLAGLVVTHAHEDHVGAVADLWPLLRCPVYTTRFTAAVLRRKLAEQGLEGTVPVVEVARGDRVGVGVFDLEWVGLTHSIPEPNAIVIRTAAGNVFHTADWKLDPAPVLGDPYDPAAYRALAAVGIDAMVCDSTNALVSGHSRSEAELEAGLEQCVRAAPGRVVVGCFGSNVARLQTLARIAERSGRRMGLIGRSLRNMVACARAAGIWSESRHLIDARILGYLPREEVLAVATGSQGEPRAALDRLAGDSHPDVSLEAGDTVIFSSRVIPGNERAVQALVRRLERLQVTIVADGDLPLPIHASGHPASEELEQMYGWVQPRIAIPVHGEAAHLAANADIARRCGVRQRLVGSNGDLFLIAPVPGIRRGAVATGRIGRE